MSISDNVYQTKDKENILYISSIMPVSGYWNQSDF